MLFRKLRPIVSNIPSRPFSGAGSRLTVRQSDISNLVYSLISQIKVKRILKSESLASNANLMTTVVMIKVMGG